MNQLSELFGRLVNIEFLERHQAVVRHFSASLPCKGPKARGGRKMTDDSDLKEK
jgi:hypothetical protein